MATHAKHYILWGVLADEIPPPPIGYVSWFSWIESMLIDSAWAGKLEEINVRDMLGCLSTPIDVLDGKYQINDGVDRASMAASRWEQFQALILEEYDIQLPNGYPILIVERI